MSEHAPTDPKSPVPRATGAADTDAIAIDEVTGLVHDLRQPLAAIAALATAAGLHRGIPPDVRLKLDQIGSQTDDLFGFCRDFLARSDADYSIDLAGVVVHAVDTARHSHAGEITVDSRPAVVRGRRATLTRIVSNLLDNACRAAGPTGRVLVRVGDRDGTAFIELVDSGPGFGRSQPGVASLGLRIVERLLAAHRGRMTIDEAPDGGTWVIVEFPPQPPVDC